MPSPLGLYVKAWPLCLAFMNKMIPSLHNKSQAGLLYEISQCNCFCGENGFVFVFVFV